VQLSGDTVKAAGKGPNAKNRGLRVLLASTMVAVGAQGLNVLLPASGPFRLFLDTVFFLAWAVGVIGLGFYFRAIWQAVKQL